MDQFDKNISVSQGGIESAKNGLSVALAKKDVALIFANYGLIIHYRIEIGLNRWRRGDDPSVDFRAGIEQADEVLRAKTVWQPRQESIDATDWNLVRTIAWLLGHQVDHCRSIEGSIRGADGALGQYLADALWDDVPSHEGKVALLLGKLASNKRCELAAATYRTYFDLLCVGKSRSFVDVLVRSAEKNYVLRGRDPFYSGGPAYMGGGPDNACVLDWELSAVLKKICWSGESIHRWRWS